MHKVQKSRTTRLTQLGLAAQGTSFELAGLCLCDSMIASPKTLKGPTAKARNLLTHLEGVAFLVPLAMTSGTEEGGGVDLDAPALHCIAASGRILLALWFDKLRGFQTFTVHVLRVSAPCVAT